MGSLCLAGWRLVNLRAALYVSDMRALELYCGIGGFAAAVAPAGVEVVAAYDASSHVVQAYKLNWGGAAKQRNILQMKMADFEAVAADIWWMSPPCAPYTRRGKQLDLEDHRTVSFLKVVEAAGAIRPAVIAMENVEGFATSEARGRLVSALDGYAVHEWVLDPTALGIPNKRPRYYMVARRTGTGSVEPGATPAPTELRDWRGFLDASADLETYRVPDEIIAKYGSGFHVMDDSESYTTCFTGSYGKSWNFTGSYLRLDDGGLRRFTPREVLSFLGFPPEFAFPDELTDKQRYKYAGNSLSIACVRHVLGVALPELGK